MSKGQDELLLTLEECREVTSDWRINNKGIIAGIISKAQQKKILDAGYLSPEEVAKKCTVAYDTGLSFGKKQERERILNKMSLERCDPDVMPYFDDYYWLPASVWEAEKSTEGGEG